MKYPSLICALLMGCPLLSGQGYQGPFFYGTGNGSSGFFAEVDYLAWYADQEGLMYAQTIDLAAVAETLFENKAASVKDIYFKQKWDSGVRGILGYKPQCHDWEVRGVYTYFYTSHKPREITSTATSIVTGNNTVLSGTAIAPTYVFITYPSAFNEFGSGTTTEDYSVNARWRLVFNQADLELSQPIYSSCTTSVRGFCGLRSAWINQCFQESAFTSVNSTVEGFELNSSIAMESLNKFSSIGARGGLELNYTVIEGLDIYSSFAGSILWGWFNFRQMLAAQFNFADGFVGNTAETDNRSHHTSIFNYDLALGLTYNVWLNCRRNLLTIRFGWEQHLYTNVNQFQLYTLDPELGVNNFEINGNNENNYNIQRGDLSLSGFVAGLAYTF